MSKKFEQLLEYVVNDEMDKANALFHDIVVAKSREIYENLIADETEEFGGDDTEDLVNDISAEEADMSEADDEMVDMGDEDSEGEEDFGDDAEDELAHDGEEDMGTEEHGMEDVEDRLVDLEDALAELKADFADIMAGDAHDEEVASDDEVVASDETEDEMDEASIFEYKEHAPKPVLAEPAGTHATSPLAKSAKSPTGAGKPIVTKDGAQGNHGVKSPGKLTTATTSGEGTKMKKVQDMKKV